jgi:purine catabolism regulator
MLFVKSLVEELGLSLAAGKHAAEARIRWVHITELVDPTPWLSGGELLLTTGLQLDDTDEQRRFVQRLADHQLAGLGLGTGFSHDRIPAALLEEAKRLDFPLFEVPYAMPFIAITEKAFGRLVNEQYETLQRGISIHKRLEQLVLEERGLDELVRALASAIGGSVVVLDGHGERMSKAEFRRKLAKAALDSIRSQVAERGGTRAESFSPDHASVSGRALALPVSARAAEPPEAWLVAVRDDGGLADFDRLILQQAVTVVALELMRGRVVLDTERRLAGEVLEEVLSGVAGPQDVQSRLRPFGVGSDAAVMVFELDEPASAQAALHALVMDAGSHALVAARGELLCAVIDSSSVDPVQLAEQARQELDRHFGSTRAAVSRRAPVTELRRSFHEARCALEVSALSNGGSTEVATYRDLGAFQFLLSVQDDETLRVYADSVLGPLANGEGDYGDELLRSLEAFLEHNGHWERAARDLACHRHTLRYRIRRIEELTGRDLGTARDRIEFWLALQARELVA